MGEVLRKWTYQLIKDGYHGLVYIDITREEFYRVLMNPLSQGKFVRVNEYLTNELVSFNQKWKNTPRKSEKKFNPNLADAKKAEKYIWRSNEEVIERDKKKPLTEIGILQWKQAHFTDAIMVFSRTDIKRVLGLWYRNHEWKPRIYVRNTTLTLHPTSAEKVIHDIQAQLWLILPENFGR